jgi:hypothetical protein
MCTGNVTLHPQSSSSFSGFQQLFNSAHKLLMVGIAHLFNLCDFLGRESVKAFRELAARFVVQDVSKNGRKDSINSVRPRCRRIRKGHNLPNVILEVDVGHQHCLLCPAHCRGELFGERVEIWQTIAGNLDVSYGSPPESGFGNRFWVRGSLVFSFSDFCFCFPSFLCKGIRCNSEDSSEFILLLIEN